MIKNPKLGKHSHNNRESLEGQLLRFIREARKLSLKEVGDMLNMKVSEVDHFENGRKFYTQDDIQRFLQCYELSPEHFNSLLKLKVINKQLVNHFLMKL